MTIKITEHAVQKAFFHYVRNRQANNPLYNLIMATPNQSDADGAAWSAQRKREGMAPGFPDISVLIPKHRFHGLFVELKLPEGRLKNTQKQWLQQLNQQNYLAVALFTRFPRDLVDLVESYIQLSSREKLFLELERLNCHRIL